MFNFEKREKLIILFLLTLLAIGLSIGLYQKFLPPIAVKTDAFTADSDLPWPAKKVNINEAALEDLDGLKGIGPALAGRILEYRSKNGNFRSIEELMKVKGIGRKLFDRIKDKVCVE
jgi:competence ComEA-like helix-hairpin-helix protein